MGADIHMYLVDKKGKILMKNLYTGRNYEWFDNLSKKGYDNVYDLLDIYGGIPDCITSGLIKEDYDAKAEIGYYGFHYIKCADYENWFKEYKPYKDAGWVTRYEKWEYETRGVIPEMRHFLNEDANPNDSFFIEIVNHYDPNIGVIENIHSVVTDIDEAYLVYYFDC